MRASTIFLLTSLCLASGLAFAAQFNDLQQRMTPPEFQAAGLNKLSPEELKALEKWIQREMQEREVVVIAAAQPHADTTGFSQPDSRTPVTSRIVGEFRGWSGKTRFVLENGQIWEQAESAEFGGVSIQNPGITINPGLLGDWRLRVKGYNSRVKVKRIK